jgi:hypothetical protein
VTAHRLDAWEVAAAFVTLTVLRMVVWLPERGRPAGTIGVVLAFTERAAITLARSAEAAARFDPDTRIRVVGAGDGVRAEFAPGPQPGDEIVALTSGVDVLVASGLRGTVDTGEHDALVLLP